MHRTFTLTFMVVMASLTGCAGKAKVDLDIGVKAPAKKAPKTAPPDEIVAASTNLGVTNDLVEECTLQIRDVGKTPKFEFNEDDLLVDDKAVLDHLATCVVSGPLAGRVVRLVGRADPRGTTEYNLGLGERRARTVASYLKRVGVKPGQITITTRGDLDAVGRDDATWRGDRRVDLELMEDTKVSTR